MFEKLFDEIKGNPATVVFSAVFVLIAYGGGLFTSKYVFEALSLEVIPKNSFVYKVDIEKEYVPAAKYTALLAQAQSLEQTRTALTASLESAKSNGDRAVYSQAVCNRFAQEINNHTNWLGQVTTRIQTLTSAFYTNGVKGEDWRQSDERQANDLRKYAEQLNQQLTKIREDYSKCI
jgi:hypothetical protein